MVTRLKPVKLMALLAAMSLAACGLYSEPTPPSIDTAPLNFEGDQVATWINASAYTFDDAGTVEGGSQAITFAQDKAHKKAGAASLQISGTMRKNLYGPDYLSDARIYLNSDKTTTVDFSSMILTANFFVQSGTVTNAQVTLNDSAGRPCQGKYAEFTATGAWQTVTFEPSVKAQQNYCDAAFDITKVAFIDGRVADGAATAPSAVVWNVDSISWAGGSAPADAAQLNFEGTQFTTWNTAGAYVWQDDYTVTGGSQAITFSQDTAHAKAGVASLKISGTMQKNAYGPDYISDARIYLNSDKTTTVDFSSKTLTANFYVQSGTVGDVEVILNDSAGKPCQGKYIKSTAAAAWQTVTFQPSDTAQRNYCDGAFDITKVAFVEVRVSDGAATASSAVVWNVDSISW